ncbi:MAG TPA: NF041680 family putative transposase [Streptosporangiaceae bacterium]|nr:NF041680 family putative transposase [Streptosporangiaceae bacterium]
MAFSMAWREAGVESPASGDQARGVLADFRGELYGCLAARADALFELADAVLCADGPVRALAALPLEPEHRRGHGAAYDAVNAGRVDIARLRWSLAALPLPAWPDGRIRLAADVSNWLRPGAVTSPERMFCHVYGRGKGNAQMIPGWPYSFVAALEPGRSSWTAVLDAVRLGPDDDETEVTAAQVRQVITRLVAAGHWRAGDPDMLIVFDAGYDVTRLARQLKDLPVEVAGRLRSDRVLYFPAPPRAGGRGRPVRHGPEFALAGPATWPGPPVSTSTATTRYGTAVAAAWDRLHPRQAHRAAWLDHDGELPVIEGTLIRLTVDRLPGDRNPPPVWLWFSRTGATPADVDRCWQSFLRRFDLEHTFRLFKQVLGWTAPKIRDPEAADRRTWLIIACHAQLRLARTLAEDLRLPWQRPAPAGRLTPARVRRGFRNIHPTAGCPASAPKPGKPGPGRPPGSKNRRPAPSYDVGKTTKRERTLKARREGTG